MEAKEVAKDNTVFMGFGSALHGLLPQWQHVGESLLVVPR
jgi:hypothetical protein